MQKNYGQPILGDENFYSFFSDQQQRPNHTQFFYNFKFIHQFKYKWFFLFPVWELKSELWLGKKAMTNEGLDFTFSSWFILWTAKKWWIFAWVTRVGLWKVCDVNFDVKITWNVIENFTVMSTHVQMQIIRQTAEQTHKQTVKQFNVKQTAKQTDKHTNS